MQPKFLQDLMALSSTGSFTKAARLRNVTHPAFGRRIKALENWAGAPLIIRDSSPVTLTPFGVQMVETAKKTMALLENARQTRQLHANHLIKVVTGRTLARTLVADWIAAIHNTSVTDATDTTLAKNTLIKSCAWSLKTAGLGAATQLLESGETDFMIAYEHPNIGLKLNEKVFDFIVLASDKLVPVAIPTIAHSFNEASATPFIGFDPGLALAKIIDERVSDSFWQTRIQTVVSSDSPDAAHALALKGLGMAWLPKSLVVNDVKSRRLVIVGSSDWQISFDVRLYRKRSALNNAAEQAWKQTVAHY